MAKFLLTFLPWVRVRVRVGVSIIQLPLFLNLYD